MTCDQVIYGLTATAIGYVHQLDVGSLCQPLGEEMLAGAGAGRSVGKARLFLRYADEVGERCCPKRGKDREHDRRRR